MAKRKKKILRKKKLPAKKKRVTSFKKHSRKTKTKKKKVLRKKIDHRKGKKLNTLYKRTRKDWWGKRTIYDIYFAEKAKSEIELISNIGQAIEKLKQIKSKFIKITVVAKDKKEFSGLSYNFSIENKNDLLDAIAILLDDIFSTNIRRSTQDYMKRIIKLKGHIIKMEIEFK